jgi:hypothetical protein
MRAEPAHGISLAAATRVWARIAALRFGGRPGVMKTLGFCTLAGLLRSLLPMGCQRFSFPSIASRP